MAVGETMKRGEKLTGSVDVSWVWNGGGSNVGHSIGHRIEKESCR